MRQLLVIVCVLLLSLGLVPAPSATAQEGVTCASFDAWEWAQLVHDTAPTNLPALDPDGDGIACPELPRGVGFAPAIWTDTIPADVEEAQIVRIIDGDTLEVLLNGVSNRVRIYRADTPETQNERHCGGPEATSFAEYALSFNDNPGVVYLERDANERDQYGRELAYVWFEVAGEPYLLNHILITNGWAEDVDYGDRKYDSQFQTSAAFAEEHQLGVYELCGAFEVPAGAAQSGQGSSTGNAASAGQGNTAPAVQPTPTPVPVLPTPTPAPAPSNAGCDPNYTPCIPAYPPDLNCPDIGFTVQVIGGDPHGLDRDRDGWGCE